MKKRNKRSPRPQSGWSKVWPIFVEAAVKVAVAVIIHQLTISPAIETLPRIFEI